MKHALHRILLLQLLTTLGLHALGSEIINGKKVPDNKMQFMASVQNDQNVHICGGFLINEFFVVTAAYCDRSNPTSVVLGNHNLKKIGDKMRYGVKRCKHPSYKKVEEGADIMLLKLSRKARQNKRIKPIPLPKTEIKFKNKQQCQVAGWGFTSDGKSVDELLMVDVPIVDLEDSLGSEIINGKKVPDNKMQFMASVQNDQNVHICGGFLINEFFVVTAAHCDRSNPTSVVLGTHNLKKIGDKMRYGVKRCKHPSYKKVEEGADIMLLKLSRKARQNKRIKPIPLPKTEIKFKNKQQCQVAGWGFTSDRKSVDELLMVDVPIVDLEDCKRIWEHHHGTFPDNVTCAGGYGTKNGFCEVLASLGLNADGSRIINGTRAPDDTFEFLVSLQSNEKHACGGFLISEDFVLTAAHCSAEELDRVVVGTHNLLNVGSENAVEAAEPQFLYLLNNKDFVVTAAHCDDGNPTSVVLGTHNLKKIEDTMRYSVKRCKHPSYEKVGKGSDIMLLKNSRNKHICGGFLIDEDFMVTAAHCDDGCPRKLN
ncbi:Granzyme E [Dissostichus eleginoides]|uniref:trypsin n=1 Tax=Dissostichus eleginoides TaxID=100907 RepID=A0AAD9C9C2_DISEL|nr:Granzyme E [Dissostichus eleginoides]